MKIVSLFSGAGGLDLGFEREGFEVIWANEYDRSIWSTYQYNFPTTILDRRSITDVRAEEIPDADGFIGGPPCQSWSEAGAGRGIKDSRGQLFHDYIRLLRAKQPRFFLAENVSGILHPKHRDAYLNILSEFESAGYLVSTKLLNANDFGVPQDRFRVIIVGYHRSVGMKFEFPSGCAYKPVLKDAISDLGEPVPAKERNISNGSDLPIANHEYFVGGYSTIYMSRNRVRSWNEPSFTIQAGGRHAPIHPKAPKMKFIEQNKRVFAPGFEKLYRRLSVRECARIQTFPDDFKFIYHYVSDGYKMIGNAVPVNFAAHLARQIRRDLEQGGSRNGKANSIENELYSSGSIGLIRQLELSDLL